MNTTEVRREMAIRLRTIVIAATQANRDVLANNLSNVGKLLNEIKQYEQSARLDFEALKEEE